MSPRYLALLTAAGLCAIASSSALADPGDDNSSDCRGLPSQAVLRAALVAARNQPNGGFNLDMWGTVVKRDGIVCAVAFTGGGRRAQGGRRPGGSPPTKKNTNPP